MDSEFAPDYPRNEDGWILFPRDDQYRQSLFPFLKLSDHPAKANLYLVQSIVEYVSQSDDTIMDIMAGTGSVMVAALVGRSVVCIEIEEEYINILEQAMSALEAIAPGITSVINIIPGDCAKVLPVYGVDHIIFSPPYCLSPETPVLTYNLVWKPIGNIQVGDELLAVDENPRRKIRKAIVEQKSIIVAESYEILLEDGRVLKASAEHGWLGYPTGTYSSPQWIKSKNITTNTYLRGLTRSTWDTDTSYEAGYLAGILDGEGWVHNEHNDIGFKQKTGGVAKVYIEMLLDRGFLPSIQYDKDRELVGAIVSNLADSLQLIGSVRPKRLLPTLQGHLIGKELPAKNRKTGQNQMVKVAAIERIPRATELIGLQTSTGTLVANGIVSHNSNILKKKKLDKLSAEMVGEGLLKYSKHPDNIGNLNEFLYHQRMERIYKKSLESLEPGGTLTIIIKNHIEGGKEMKISERAARDCEKAGFKLVDWFKWLPPGSAYASFMKARGDPIVDEENIIILRKPSD